eukprot:scaffold1843_cov87-Cylindrotheca_fusiformis.AAC.4
MIFYTLSLAISAFSAVASIAAAIDGDSSSAGSVIAGYHAKSQITGSRIDLDQAEMERHLAVGDFDKATIVYKEGGHEAPYAQLSLETPLREAIPANTKVVGMNQQGQHIDGTLMATTRPEATILYVHYDDVDCQVSGIHQHSPNNKGCFQASGGLVLEGHGAVNYHYQPMIENQYYSTLYGFSEHEAEKMFHCKDKCPYVEYEKYYRYYGHMDYGTLWIEHALAGTDTKRSGDPLFLHGNQDFSQLSVEARGQAVATATLSLNVFTQINRILTEWSVEVCEVECGNGNSRDHPVSCPKAANNWDLAVSTYVGSMEVDHSGNGHLLYSLANTRCKEFGTCDNSIAKANHKIIDLFRNGRTMLEAGNCMDAAATKFQIVSLVTVPFIQGLLKAAYYLDGRYDLVGKMEEEKGRGIAFAAAILPELHACSPHDAAVVEHNFRFGKDSPKVNFKSVRDALERNYNCLEVRCGDIGGLVLESGSTRYHPDIAPCHQRRMTYDPQHEDTSRKGAIGNVFLLCTVAAALVVGVKRSKWIRPDSSSLDFREFSHSLSLDHQQNPFGSERSYEMKSSSFLSSTEYHPIEDELNDQLL